MNVWFVVAIAAAVGYVAWLYNRVIALRNRAGNAWSDIDVQLKRRWDLVPALVTTVRGYATHEQQTLQQVVEARTDAMAAAEQDSPGRRGRMESSLSSAAHRIVALVEAYPDLRANERFLELQRSLVEIENTIQSARRYYNAVVRDYNVLIATVPTVALASLFRFGPLEYFQIEQDERAVPSAAV